MPEWAAEEIVDAELARRLIDGQFPGLEAASIELVGEGWDNTVWLVDEAWIFRFPRRAVAVPAVERQIVALPRLASLLPLPIPTPVYRGLPAEGFPWPFYGAPFIPGREVADVELDDTQRVRLGAQLAAFLRALHSPEAYAALREVPLTVDPMGRGDMAARVPRTRDRLAEVERLGLWAAPPSAYEVIDEARGLPPPGASAVVHGDLHFRHLLVTPNGEAAGVIDWDDICIGDPAIDLVLYWCLLPTRGRGAFREECRTIDDRQLLRARVLAFFLCATLAVYARHEGMSAIEREAVAGLDRTASD
jgi:aminoglycoside phosphotransferase (APT) family kinase protein